MCRRTTTSSTAGTNCPHDRAGPTTAQIQGAELHHGKRCLQTKNDKISLKSFRDWAISLQTIFLHHVREIATDGTWVKYRTVLDSTAFLRFPELDRCIESSEILLKSANPAFCYSRLAQMHQAGSIGRRKVFESKQITYVTQVRRY